jgi:hypothetical protein
MARNTGVTETAIRIRLMRARRAAHGLIHRRTRRRADRAA